MNGTNKTKMEMKLCIDTKQADVLVLFVGMEHAAMQQEEVLAHGTEEFANGSTQSKRCS